MYEHNIQNPSRRIQDCKCHLHRIIGAARSIAHFQDPLRVLGGCEPLLVASLLLLCNYFFSSTVRSPNKGCMLHCISIVARDKSTDKVFFRGYQSPFHRHPRQLSFILSTSLIFFPCNQSTRTPTAQSSNLPKTFLKQHQQHDYTIRQCRFLQAPSWILQKRPRWVVGVSYEGGMQN